MSLTDKTIETDVYLQIERDSRYRYEGRVRRATTKRPDPPLAGTVTVKLKIVIPQAAFEPLKPEAVVVVPDSMVQPNPIEVEATDPDEG